MHMGTSERKAKLTSPIFRKYCDVRRARKEVCPSLLVKLRDVIAALLAVLAVFTVNVKLQTSS